MSDISQSFRVVERHRDEILVDLASHGFSDVRVPSDATGVRVELLVTADDHVDLAGFIAAQESLSNLLGFDVYLIPAGSELAHRLTPGSVAL